MDSPTDSATAGAATLAPPGARHPRRAVALVGTCLVWALWPLTGGGQELIVNNDFTQQQVTRNEARLYFTLRLQQWPDRWPVRVFVLPDEDPLHIAFAKDVLRLFPYQLRGAWDRQVFSGTGQAPTRVADEDEMIQRVATTPGAIGYARAPPRDPRVHTLEVR